MKAKVWLILGPSCPRWYTQTVQTLNTLPMAEDFEAGRVFCWQPNANEPDETLYVVCAEVPVTVML